MATIAKMIVDVGADPAGLRAGLSRASAHIRDFARTASAQAGRVDIFGNMPSRAAEAARNATTLLRREFADSATRLREDLFRGVINPKEFAHQSREAARQFNAGLTSTLDSLQAKGLLNDRVRAGIVAQYKDLGLQAGNEFAKQLNQVGGALTSVGKSMTRNVTLPLLAVGVGSLKVASDFEVSMNLVQAWTNAGAQEMVKMSAIARELGATTQFSAADAGNAMNYLAQSSLNASQIMEAIPGTVQLAAAANLDMAAAADIATNILFGYGMAATEMAHVNDVLIKTQQRGKSTMEELNHAFRYVGPVASSVGISFNEVAAAMALLGRAGIRGSMAGTSLRTSMSRLLSPTKEAQELMDKLGLNAAISGGKLTSLADVINILAKSGATAGQMLTLFGDRAGPAMVALTRQGSNALVALRREMENSGGTAQKLADAQMKGLRGAMRLLKSAAEELAIAMSETGLLKAVTNAATSFARFLVRVSQVNPTLLKTAVVVGVVVAAAGPMLIVVGQMVIAFNALRAAVIALQARAALGGLAAMLTPAGAVLAGLALLAGALWLAGRRGREAREDMDKFRESIQKLTPEQLTVKTTDLMAQMDALQKRKAELDRKLAARVEADRTSRNDLANSAAPVAADLRKVNELIARTQQMIDATVTKFNEQKQASAAAAAETVALQAEIQAMLDSQVTPTVSVDKLDEMAGVVNRITSLYELMNTEQRYSTGLIDAAVARHRELKAMLEAERDPLSENALKLRQMIDDLKQIDVVKYLEGEKITLSVELIPLKPMRVESQAITAPAPQNIVTPELSGLARIINNIRASSDVANRGMYAFTASMRAAGTSIASGFASVGRQLLTMLNPLTILNEVFGEVIRSMAPSLEKLAEPLARIVKVVADALAPVFEALAPVIEAFIPIIRALMGVLMPIFRALLPILQAFVPILEALFPIIKAAAIAFTYVAQAALTVGAIALDVIGLIAVGFGKIVEGIARAVDKLPGISARSAIEAGKNIQRFGHGMQDSADEFRRSAREMARARDEIRRIEIDPTAVAVEDLGQAARETTESLRNLPTGFRVALARFQATQPAASQLSVVPSAPDAGTTTRSGGTIAAPEFFRVDGDVVIQAAPGDSGEQLFDKFITAARKKARAQLGDANRWMEMV